MEIDLFTARKQALSCKWAYKIKYHNNGTIEHYKAWIGAIGNIQVEGEDFYESFALVAKMDTICCLLSTFICKRWELLQMDMHNASLHRDLD